jgi:hypothetical protein
MARTERWGCVASSIALLVALSAAPGVAAPVASDATAERSSTLVSASPAVFAERVTAAHQAASARGRDALQNAVELIVLAGICAIAVAFYTAASTRRADPDEPPSSRPR